MIPNTMMMAMAEAQHALDGNTGDITEKLKIAMNITRGHWLITDEDERFRSAIGAVMMHYGKDSQEFKRLEWELVQLRKISAGLNAMQQGISVDLESMVSEESEFKPIGLMKLWKEIK